MHTVKTHGKTILSGFVIAGTIGLGRITAESGCRSDDSPQGSLLP